MRQIIGLALGLALVLFAGAQIAIVVGLASRREFRRAALAFLLPPLAPVWAFEAGLVVPAWLWIGSFVAYAIGLAVPS